MPVCAGLHQNRRRRRPPPSPCRLRRALKRNNTLEILNLHNNNITDDSGIQSIIDVLKTNNTLRRLNLYNNQLSDNMYSQLNAIQQYKRDGSNGYQQVKGMWIYT